MLLALLLGCDPGPAAADDSAPPTEAELCDGDGDRYVGVISGLAFSRPDEAGVCDGFDLDGLTTVPGQSSGCGIGDYVAPDGAEGVDHGFARILPALELTEAAAVEAIIQETIDTGELLILFELSDVDDLRDDPCVDFTVFRGAGEVMLGTDGRVEAWQTFDVDPDFPPVVVEDVPLVDGELVARPITVQLPVSVLNANLTFILLDGAFAVRPGDDGGFTGIFAGGLEGDYLIEVASTENIDPEIVGLLEGLLEASSDLAPGADGTCEQISVTFGYEAQPAFVFEDR